MMAGKGDKRREGENVKAFDKGWDHYQQNKSKVRKVPLMKKEAR